MGDYESYFRLFKSSWGILIGFKGEILEMSEEFEMNDLIKINDFLYLQLNISNENKYIHNNKTKLENGIQWVSEIFPKQKKVLIKINEIDLNFCNFQIEGLFFGIASWICNYYKVEMPNYHSTFDKDSNKYLFSFDENDEISKKLLYPLS
ncbi:hypothetical protein NJT12_14635 [Flavobacterium sp. AC]|uniref:Uncharacterized protein n=1 Tax=Flavobacterium azizsancarii TaxID=2961580 RepID=A0ABT4WE75_9FLAO|nr:hypothetical protein [Flavobacterium azizsancarii]MDA6070852.1 hypothetical protein [Flavobacterium azizsancarii]